MRDAEVRLQTVRQLREFARGKKRSFRETEELLAFELDSFLAAFSEWPEEAKQRLTQALDRIQAWPLDDLRCKQLRKCVQKTYKRGRKALEAAIKKTSTKNLHTFRKRAKELWYQLRILRPLAPAVFAELNDELKAIGQYLGQVHDLAFVDERLSSIGSARKQGDRILNALIDSREKELERTAIALGERFYAERPRQFARRISQYFSEWETAKIRCLSGHGRTGCTLELAALRSGLVTTSPPWALSLESGSSARQDVADQARRRQSQQPRPDDSLDDGPFYAAETFHGADAHDRRGNDVSGRERNAPVARGLNNHGGGRLGSEAVHRLQLHHLVAERANDSPATGGRARSHGGGAENDDPFGDDEIRRAQEVEHGRNIVERAALRAGEEGEGDDAHGFLSVIRSMAVRHPRGTDQLRLPEDFVDDVRRKRPQQQRTSRAIKNAPSKKPMTGEENIGTTTFGIRPVFHFSTDQSPSRRCDRRAAQAADQARDWSSTANPSTMSPGSR